MRGELPATMTLLLAGHRARRELDLFRLHCQCGVVLEQLELIWVDRFTTSTEQAIAHDSELAEQFLDAIGLLCNLIRQRINDLFQDRDFVNSHRTFDSQRHDVESSADRFKFKLAYATRRA